MVHVFWNDARRDFKNEKEIDYPTIEAADQNKTAIHNSASIMVWQRSKQIQIQHSSNCTIFQMWLSVTRIMIYGQS